MAVMWYYDVCAKGRKWRKQAAETCRDWPGTGLGVVSVSEKSNTDTDQPQLKQLETKSGWGLIPASVQNTFMS